MEEEKEEREPVPEPEVSTFPLPPVHAVRCNQGSCMAAIWPLWSIIIKLILAIHLHAELMAREWLGSVSGLY